ncbi:MAG: glycosyl hydrolase family 8 [Methylobacter sp.]|jgi:endoglucanase|nr:glycosyl hydrolase family 8 [Methylobacter sp.]
MHLNKFLGNNPIPRILTRHRHGIRLRLFVPFLLCLLTFGQQPLAAAPPSEAEEWKYFVAHFISGDGRVIDPIQNAMSHSEGQGYGMLLAVHFQDKALFDKLLQWTTDNLQVRRDGLSAWGWGKRPNDEWNAIDYNNATDGDVLIAYALIRAGQKWDQKEYTQRAAVIVQSLRTHLAVNQNNRTYLLSGYYGFADNKGLVLNPSYQLLTAYQAFTDLDDRRFWEKISLDALHLLDEADKNPNQLPADWVLAEPNGDIKIYQAKSPLFSYEAIRVLLYLAWAKLPQPDGVKTTLDYYQKHGSIPEWFDLTKDKTASEAAPAGFYAIFARAAEQLGNTDLATRLKQEAGRRLQNEPDAYYSHVLYLLAGVD